MSKKTDELTQDLLSHRWQASAATTNATCQAVSPVPQNGLSRPHIDGVMYSLSNNAATANVNATLTIRAGATSASTVLGQMAVTTPAAQSKEGCVAFVHFFGKRGVAMSAEWTGQGASVYQSISLCGWQEIQR